MHQSGAFQRLDSQQVRFLNHINKSIGLMQAVIVLFASVVIGLGLGAVQLKYAFTEQREIAIALAHDILALAEGGASNAAWTLDQRLAADVVSSVMAITGVHKAEIADERDVILANAVKPAVVSGWLKTRFVRTFIPEPVSAGKRLYAKESGQPRRVGYFSVSLAPDHIAERFLNLTFSTVIVSLVEACLIGLVLLWLSMRLVTSPLRQLTKNIAAIDPQQPDDMYIRVPQLHQSNELGHLVQHTNGMLERLALSQDQLRHLATRDPLTGLPNRVLIRDRLNNALARAKRNNSLVAVLFLDLDRFKNVNDSLGHDAGDDLLVAVSETIVATIRAQDSAGRLGGDEFLVVLEDVHDLEEVAQAVKRLCDVLSTTFPICSQDVRAPASIGISVFPNDGEDVGTLMRHADLAMYKAKSGGGTRWHFYARGMSAKVESRLKQEAALDRALERKELAIHYQPKFESLSGNLAGCEALLRWRHNGRLVSAREFILVAEDTGIILEIGDWVMDQVCRLIRHWSTQFRPIPVAVNVSTRQLRDEAFVERVLKIAKRYGIDTSLLELEITETVLMHDLEHNYKQLARLRDEGIVISIDDFGTGYSSLSYLTQLPINALKIDKSFVSGAQRSTVVLSTIIAMAKALQIKTVAEGVETDHQQSLLTGQGCDFIQGYLPGSPVSADEFAAEYLNPKAHLSLQPIVNKQSNLP